MGGMNQVGKEVMTFQFDVSLTLTWKSKSLIAKIFKYSMNTI